MLLSVKVEVKWDKVTNTNKICLPIIKISKLKLPGIKICMIAAGKCMSAFSESIHGVVNRISNMQIIHEYMQSFIY